MSCATARRACVAWRASKRFATIASARCACSVRVCGGDESMARRALCCFAAVTVTLALVPLCSVGLIVLSLFSLLSFFVFLLGRSSCAVRAVHCAPTTITLHCFAAGIYVCCCFFSCCTCFRTATCFIKLANRGDDPGFVSRRTLRGPQVSDMPPDN